MSEPTLHIFGRNGCASFCDSFIEGLGGAVWRVERNQETGMRGERCRVIDFLVKYVRPGKIDGCYLPDITGGEPVWNLDLHVKVAPSNRL